MARMRSVKPEFWADEDLSDVPRDGRLLYIGLWNLADEHSRLRGDPRYVKGQLFPYDDDLVASDVDELLAALEKAGKVVRYRVGSGQYLFLPNLAKHQRLETEKVPSRLPPPPGVDMSPQVGTPDDDPPSVRANKSAPDTDESESGTKDHALKHVAGSREHVAGSSSAAREQHPDGLRRIITDATGATPEEADRIIDRVKRERQPRSLAPFLRRMATDGDLADWLKELRSAAENAEVRTAIQAIRDGPPCEHGQPGGALPHPTGGEPTCPLCRAKARRAS